MTRKGAKKLGGKVRALAVTPMSYIVDTPSGQFRRNSRHLIPVPEEQPEEREGSQNNGIPVARVINHAVCSPIMTRFRIGVLIRPPVGYQEV